MNNFEMHDMAEQLSDTMTAYQLARILIKMCNVVATTAG